MDLRHLKAGDEVYVVFQRRRGDERLTAKAMPVVRVDDKCGYIVRYGEYDEPFDLTTGKSHHAGPYASHVRLNGEGFDVYPTEAAYLREQHERAEFRRLRDRLITRSNRIIDLPPDVVEKIHRVLDDAKL